jgi:uncharacterized sulfatase
MTRLVNAYDNSIRHIDGLVEAVVDTLGSAGWLDDSVIILTSDHGEALGDRLNLFHGTTAYEEQVHVPLLVRVGRHLESLGPVVRERHDGITGLVDIAPSVLSMMAGMRRPVTLGFQGHSWLLGRTSKAYELVVFRGLAEKAAIITTRHKYIFDAVSRTAEAYDLEKDPRERSNLWNEPVAGSSVQFIEELKNRSVLR